MIRTLADDDDARLAEAHRAYVECLAEGVGQYLVNPFRFATFRDKLAALTPPRSVEQHGASDCRARPLRAPVRCRAGQAGAAKLPRPRGSPEGHSERTHNTAARAQLAGTGRREGGKVIRSTGHGWESVSRTLAWVR